MPPLDDPRELVALSTFDPRPGGENCAHMPENALEEMKATDALVIIEEQHGGPESGGGTLADYPERPEHFGAEHGYRSEAVECLDQAKAFFDRFIPFRDAGRRFYAYVAFGSEAPPTIREQAWTILDRLEVDTRRTSFRLKHDGVAIEVPAGWDGRVMFLNPSGSSAILQVANFELPEHPGFNPPPELPPGEEDPIKAMSGGDVLITLVEGSGGEAGSSPPIIRPADFLPSGPRIPRGHAVAERAFCWHGGCFEVTVDFARAPADPGLIERVNEVLASVSVTR
jgi:hypothetical protein